MILRKHVVLLVLGVALVSFSGSTWFAGNGDAQFPRLPKHSQLFPSVGKVVEIPDGSMERFTDVLQPNGVNAVLFYAPWCGQSLVAAQEFNRVAQMLYKEISFIAINCWMGSCFQQQKMDVFPKLVAIHTRFDGLEYKGPFKALKMVAFLQSIIRPFVYIATNAELKLAKRSNQELVISYFDQPLISNKNYTSFFSLALQFRIKDSRPTFAVVTSTKIALKAGVTSPSGLAYHRLNHDVLNFPSSGNFTVQDITSWIDANRYELVVQLILSSDRKEHAVRHLSKGPAVILFLPIKLHMSEVMQQLLNTFIHAASLYFNCSCKGMRKGVNTTSQSPEASKRDHNTSVTFKRINFNERTSDTSQLTLLNVMKKEQDVLITEKDWNLPFLFVHKSTCQSLLVPKRNVDNKRNICDVCHTCQRQKCQHNMGHGLGSFLNSNVVTALLSLNHGCNTFRPSYFSFTTTSICCTEQTGETTHQFSSLRQIKNMNLESLRQAESGLEDLFGELLSSVIPPLNTATSQRSVNKKRENDHQSVKETAQQAFPVQEHYDPLQALPSDKTSKNTCTATGHVTHFAGAGCFSNKSVRFFIVDSTEYWEVAENLGVINTPKGKIALVIADLKNDAQFVLDEDLQINDSSIVEFVMAYMAGNLTRRFRSGRARSSVCVSSQGAPCITEVVTSNFQQIVLDETKDVLLLFYTPWCGYCQALEPVLLTVAKFFQGTNDVIVGRINADENDLPWELYVPHYPSFIHFPAYRKGFSVRFPDSVERTASNIVHFMLDHGVKASKVFNDFFSPETAKDQVNELETFLFQVEEKKGIIEVRLGEAVRLKKRWYHISAVNLKSLKLTKTALDQERKLRLSSRHLNKLLKQQQQQLEEKFLKLTKRSTDVLNELIAANVKLNQNEKLLTQLSHDSRTLFLENGQLFSQLRKTEVALRDGKKVVEKMQKSMAALRRRTTQLQFSISILRTRLINLTQKGTISEW